MSEKYYICPYCLEEALKYAIIDIDGTNIEEGYSCKECGAEFIGTDNEEVIRVNRTKKISPSTQVYNRLLEKLDCRRGAPMGRPNIGTKDDAEGKRIYCRYVPLVYDGAYDRGGAYWGSVLLYMSSLPLMGLMLIFTEKNKLAMLKRANFTIKFSIDGIDMQEEYSLSYRTEEWDNLLDNERLNPSLTHIQQAKQYIAKDLGVRRYWVTVNNICKTHNHLIIE